jgi:hypothetical protein
MMSANVLRSPLFAGAAVALLSLTSCRQETPDGPPEGFAAAFYVAPQGNDAHPGTPARPFASLERARDAVREIRPSTPGDILVSVAAGDYFLKQTFVLDPRDSGPAGAKTIYRSEGVPGSARLIGGTRLAGWQPSGEGGIFQTKIPDNETGHDFHTLSENGIRARKARFPNYQFDARFPLSGAPYLETEDGSDSELIWQDGDLKAVDWSALGDEVNVVVWPWGYADWHKATRRIGSVDPTSRSISIPDHKGSAPIGKRARYYLEGSRAFLDQPGEFFLDRDKGVLFYWPRFGDPNKQEIIAPRLRRLISLEGKSAGDPVRNVVIEGFGLMSTDTFAAMTGPTLFPWSVSTGYGAHGLVHLRYTEDVEILDNHIRNAGLSAIYLDRSNKRDRIAGNWIEDAGISGIVLAYHREAKAFPHDLNEGNIIENNLIHGLGSLAVDSAGVNVWGARDNLIRHCEIFDGARYGVSIRGNFSQSPAGSSTKDMTDTNRPVTGGNRVESSHFHHLGQDSGDMGAVHMAGISSLKIHPVNTLENLLIEDIVAHPSMKDVKPNGIFFDYPQGVTDQVLRNIEIRGTTTPFRVNNTDIRHIYENVSWKDGFDPGRVPRDAIGLRPDFPANFRRPREVEGAAVRERTSGGERVLEVSWNDPKDKDLRRIILTVEGEPGETPVEVDAGVEKANVPRPAAKRLCLLRVQTEDEYGNRSFGILIPAAARPPSAQDLTATGIDHGIRLAWSATETPEGGFRIVTNDPNVAPLDVGPEAREATLTGLEDAKAYDVRIDSIDRDGHPWPGPERRVAAGRAVPIPADAAAWWTFDEPRISAGLSIGDASGRGNTLFVGNDKVEGTEGKFGRALRFDGKTAYARVLDTRPLAIGTGDFAVSLWIRQAPTVHHTQRVFEFGGTGEPGLSIMANPTDVRTTFTAGGTRYAPFYRGLALTDKWTHVVVNIRRDQELALYVDGVKLASEDISATSGVEIPAAPYLHLARFKNTTDPKLNWPGEIDQVRIFQRALEPSEIMALHQEGRPASP